MDFTNLRKQLEIIGKDSVSYLIKLLAENDKRATGDLIKSINFKIIQDVNGLLLQILADPHFKYVDEGRRKGAKQPPIKPIKSWLEHKKIRFKDMSNTSAAFMIARSISENGIKPLHLKDKLFKNILNNKEILIKYASQKDIDELVKNIIITNSKK